MILAGGLALTSALAPGCSFLLSRNEANTRSPWRTFGEAQSAFEHITPGNTPTEALAGLGFDPRQNPNVRILTYLDVQQRFMANPSITKADLDPAVRAYLDHREQGQAWEVEANEVKTKRYGNALLDVTGFVKKTHETGWHFKGLLLILDGRVVYKLASGQPNLDRYEKRTRPLGPLQEADGLLLRVVEQAR